MDGGALPWRSLQVGLGGAVVHRYVDDWVVGLTDITDQVRELRLAARSDPSLLPREHPYPLPDDVALTVGADLA